jgi:hypothetical protein
MNWEKAAISGEPPISFYEIADGGKSTGEWSRPALAEQLIILKPLPAAKYAL